MDDSFHVPEQSQIEGEGMYEGDSVVLPAVGWDTLVRYARY